MRKLLVVLLMLAGLPASAFDKQWRWTSSTSATFPVIPVFGCPNAFSAFFPGFPWANIRGQTMAGLNEWFVHGNADVRMRYRNDLVSTDPRCTLWSGLPNPGEITFTAESAFGGGSCRLGTTFWTWDTAGNLTSAKVILHRGCSINGTIQNYNWATNADFPGASQVDFLSVILHEFGHALGFVDSTTNTLPSAIMYPSIGGLGDSSKRNLSRDDQLGLQDPRSPYGPIQTTSLHRYSAASQLWGWWDEGEPTTSPMFGSPAVDHSTRFSPVFYAMAYARPSDRQIMFGRTYGSGTTAFTSTSISTTRPPAIVGDSLLSQEIIAAVQDTEAGEPMWLTSANGTNWTQAGTMAGESTRVTPAVAYESYRGRVIYAWAHHPSGKIRIRTSLDNGATFGRQQELFFPRTHQQFGLACPSQELCVLVYSDSSTAFTRLAFQYLILDASYTIYEGGGGTLGMDSYGAGVDGSSARLQMSWRDRGSATVATTGGWGTPGLIDTLTYLPSSIQSAPDIAFNPSWSEFTLWSVFASRYQQ